MRTDPRGASPRDDLPYLRRRRRPRPQPEAAPTPKISFARPAKTKQPAAEQDSPQPAAQQDSPQPAAQQQSPPAASSVSSSLDLDEPEPVAQTATAPEPADRARSVPDEPARRVREDARVNAGRRKILTITDPTVTLTPLQSGIGTLRFEAAVSAAAGGLRLACAYQLRSGFSSVLLAGDGTRGAPPDDRCPVLVAGHDHSGRGFPTVAVDLRRSRELRRLAVCAYSESGAAPQWGGTLVVETFGGARVELPLDSLSGGTVAVLSSLYNVRGEFVLRAEMQTLRGDVREACRAYGYDKITWLDGRTPLD